MLIKIKTVPRKNIELNSLAWLKEHGITQSILKTWRSTCPKKARYILNGYHKPQSSGAILFGEIFHSYLEEILTMVKNKWVENALMIPFEVADEIIKKSFEEEMLAATPQIKREYEKNLGMAAVVIREYFDYWADEYFGSNKKTWIQIEDKFKIFPKELNGVPLTGRRDGVFSNNKNKIWLFETKTKSSWDDDNLLKLLFRELQVILYIKSYQIEFGTMPEGVLYNLIRRPQLRLKDTESIQDFCIRIENDIKSRQSFYFSKLEMPIPSKIVEHNWEKILHDCQEFINWFEGNSDSEYTENCVNNYGACPFLLMCSGGIDDKIIRREIIYKELEKE